jgi:zinc and cadmium transporter
MVFNFNLLFFTALIAGSLAYFIPKWREEFFKLVLVFAGSYLFAITVLHILPELFTGSNDPTKMGLYILLGFLLQQILELLSSGIEHGHIHHSGRHSGIHPSIWTLMTGLFLHAFLEGTLLSHDGMLSETLQVHVQQGDHEHGSNNLLFGILLHKGPEAFALVAVLLGNLKKRWVFTLLTIFALASPLGMVISSYLHGEQILGRSGLGVFYGIVAGGFLHISTTIFFESSPGHKFHLNKVLISIIAFSMAVALEMLS